MEDIIDIYDPIFRPANYTTIIVITVLSILALSTIIFFVIKYIKGKSKIITPEERYKAVLNSYLLIDKEESTSLIFSQKISYIFKEYLETWFSDNYQSSTSEELVNKLKRLNLPNIDKLSEIFKNQLDHVLYANSSLTKDQRKEIMKEIVDSITFIYNKEAENNV